MLQSNAVHAPRPAHWRGTPLSAVFFDLDGTLLDTAADIALALNRTLTESGWSAVTLHDVRDLVGRGAPVLIERVASLQGRAIDQATLAKLVARFFAHYGALEAAGDCTAQPYAGAMETLRELRMAGLRLAVVTNKQERFADSLLRYVGMSPCFDLLVGGDTCERRKPDPQPVLYACSKLGLLPSQAIMVGDSINDVEAAHGAGMPVLCVPYGYNEGRDPRQLPCDALIETLSDLPPLLLSGGNAG
jgi:phosphoglycolate phosphatase